MSIGVVERAFLKNSVIKVLPYLKKPHNNNNNYSLAMLKELSHTILMHPSISYHNNAGK